MWNDEIMDHFKQTNPTVWTNQTRANASFKCSWVKISLHFESFYFGNLSFIGNLIGERSKYKTDDI